MYTQKEITQMINNKIKGGLEPLEAVDAVYDLIEQEEFSGCDCEDYPCCGH